MISGRLFEKKIIFLHFCILCNSIILLKRIEPFKHQPYKMIKHSKFVGFCRRIIWMCLTFREVDA